MNILVDRSDDFVSVEYSTLLKKIKGVLEEGHYSLFKANRHATFLTIYVDQMAVQVAQSARGLEHPLGTRAKEARVATVHFADASARDRFITQISELDKLIETQLAAAIDEATGETVEAYIAHLLTPLQHFTGSSRTLGLHYAFDQSYYNLEKQRLSLHDLPDATPILRFHKLTVIVNGTDKFRELLRRSVENYIEQAFGDESTDDLDDLREVLTSMERDTSSDLSRLQQIINRESLGKIKKEAQICYLEFLQANLRQKNEKGVRYLQDLIRRLRLIEAYLGDLEQADGHFVVSYDQSPPLNYRDLFARADVFNSLPIIPVILEGSLGETKDEERGGRTFIFGIKLKFNGKVTNQDLPKPLFVFDYNLQLLDPSSQLHQEKLNDPLERESFQRRVLTRALLYFCVFHKFGDLEHDPINLFNQVLVILRGSDEAKKRTLLTRIKNAINTSEVRFGIKTLKEWLQRAIKRIRPFEQYTFPIHILVKRGILERDLHRIMTERTFFKPVFGDKSKEALRYLSIGEAKVGTPAFCKLRAEIVISNLHYSPTKERQRFSMRYHIDGMNVLPLLITPKESTRELYKTYFRSYRLLIFPYTSRYLDQIRTGPDSPPAFAYRFTFALLSYLTLNRVLAHCNGIAQKLFVPLLRLHVKKQRDWPQQEIFMRQFSKILGHLLNEDVLSNAQGFDVGQNQGNINAFKLKNGLSSLYAVLPKRFQFAGRAPKSQVDKLAIVIVSSRECDRKKGSSARQKMACLIGQVIGVERVDARTVQVEQLKSFADNYHFEQMVREPTVLIDEVGRLYEQGYRHFIYVAKSPYTRTLHLTEEQEDERLFFMSRSIIQALKADRPDLKLYPVFFDTYSVVKLNDYPKGNAHSFFIQDTRELMDVMEDASKQAVIFFNLLNGISVGRNKEERYYNGVISYSTLLNMYEGILDDQEIRSALLYEDNLKRDILTYLTLFHFSRYEAVPKRGTPISLKLNPYQTLIGQKSVGKRAAFRHMTGSGEWNVLAFLAEVRKVLRGPQKS